MREDRMKEYVTNGGRLFSIINISTIRDGGTKVLETVGDDFYIHKDNKTFHSGYSPNNDNIINNSLLIEYLIDRIESYIKDCEDDIKWNRELLNMIIKNNF